MISKDRADVWHIVTLVVQLFGFPVTLFCLIYRAFGAFQQKRGKANLAGKVVMITGASSGLGEALAEVFFLCGCKLILVSRRKEQLERVRDKLLGSCPTIQTYPPVVVPLDLTEINQLPNEVEKVLRIHKRIDILINNAGVSYRGEVSSTNVDVDIKVMLINYFAHIALAKAILPSMIARKSGHIVCVGSVQAKIAIPHRSAYAASKHALQAWCDTARAELADRNIDVTMVNTGYIQTQLSVNAFTGSGKKYGTMDKATAEGYTPIFVAEEILKGVVKRKKELLVAGAAPKTAIYLRFLLPSLYFWIMQRRAKKENKDN